MDIKIGTHLAHKALGRCRVTEFNPGGKFTVLFHSGKTGMFRLGDADTFFSEDTLQPKYKISRILDNDTAALLERFDGGDYDVWAELISKLEEIGEVSAVDVICSALKALGAPPPSFVPFLKERELRGKYEIAKGLDRDSSSLLERFDSGNTEVAIELIKKLDVLGEAAAVNLICDRLAAADFKLTHFLLIKKGKALRRLRKIKDALAVANKALELSESPKEKSISLTTRAAALKDLGQIVEAHKDCDDALAIEPDSFHARRVLGSIYVKRGNYIEADAQFLLAASLAGLESKSVAYGLNDYVNRIKEFKDENRRGDIEQILDHIKTKWPPEMAERALRVIHPIINAL